MLPEFELFTPQSLDEAVSSLAVHNKARILAGGTDVLVQMQAGNSSPEVLIDIKQLGELKIVEFCRETGLVIGALATHRELEVSPLIRERYGILHDGVSRVGSVQIRNRATVGGNLCSALPSADSAAPLLALNARVKIYGPRGVREIPLDKFFIGAKKTDLRHDEILTHIIIPPLHPINGGAYIKYTRREAMDLALLGIALFLEMEDDQKTCRTARIALATAAPTPMRAYQAELAVQGHLLNEEVFKNAAEVALQEVHPRSSWRASEEFRRRLIKHLIPRAGMLALERQKMVKNSCER